MKRKLLLIMPNFFDYPQAICEELEKMGGWGYEVDCFDDRPSTNGMVKAIIRVNKNLIGQYINRYFEKVMKTAFNFHFISKSRLKDLKLRTYNILYSVEISFLHNCP